MSWYKNAVTLLEDLLASRLRLLHCYASVPSGEQDLVVGVYGGMATFEKRSDTAISTSRLVGECREGKRLCSARKVMGVS